MAEEVQDDATSPSPFTKIADLKLPSTCDPPSDSNPPSPKVWVIFGATGQLGRSLVRTATSHADLVTAVGWSSDPSAPPISETTSAVGKTLSLSCDVRVRDTVAAVLKQSIAHWGRVDIIANCTGYGVIGACEDQSEHELRSQFETNFWGTLNIVQLSVGYFHSVGGGRYLIFSSTSGALGTPGLGPFCATKYAVEGLVESMLYEVDGFGIKASLIEPGHMRMDDPATRGSTAKYSAFKVKRASAPYGGAHAPAGHARRMVQWLNDRQPVSTVRSAELCWQLAHCKYPPLRLLLGSYAVESIRDRMRSVIEEIEDWKHLSFPADQALGGDGEDGEDGNGAGEEMDQ